MLTVERPAPTLGLRAEGWCRAHPWIVLGAWSALLGLLHARGVTGVSWHSFVHGTRILFSAGGAHLYAAHSGLQIGPAAYLPIAPIVFLLPGPYGLWAAMAMVFAAGLLLLAQVRAMALAGDPRADRRFLLGGAVLLVVWSQLAITYVHPDDALALLLTVVALRLIRADRPLPAALALAVAADCKPWALAFVPLLMLAERRRLAALTVWAAAVTVAWLPFYLADPASSAAARFRIPNVAMSSLRVLGVDSSATPLWDRPAQIVLGAGLAVLAVRRDRAAAVVLVAVAARLLLDPGTKSYYDAGLLVGALLVDVIDGRGPLPVLSLSAVVLFSAPRVIQSGEPHLYGLIRTVFLLTVVAIALVRPPPGVSTTPETRPSRRSRIGSGSAGDVLRGQA